MATIGMTTALGCSSRKFDWADDDEDDFDLDAWMSSADTSAPTAEELGPLQLSDSSSDPSSSDSDEDAYAAEDSSPPQLCHYTLSSSDSDSEEDDEYDDAPVVEASCPPQHSIDSFPSSDSSDEVPMEEPSPLQLGDSLDSSSDEEEQAVAPPRILPSILFCPLSVQLAKGRFIALSTALGPSLDGKDHCNLPAYPELSYCKEKRSCYARKYQEERLFWGRDRATVYRQSHLVIATHIDNAETIDRPVRMGFQTHNGEDLNNLEIRQIEMFEAEEKEDAMIVQSWMEDRATNPDSVFRGYSEDQLTRFYADWKAEEAGQTVGVESSKEDSEDESVQAWEESDGEEDETSEEDEMSEEEDGEHHSCTKDSINPDKENKVVSSTTRIISFTTLTSAETKDDNVELDFNGVTFDTEDEPTVEDEEFVEDAASCHSVDSSKSWATDGSDEGYTSDTPEIPGNAAPKAQSYMATFGHPFSPLSARRKTQTHGESIKAISVFRDTMQSKPVVESAIDSDSESEGAIEVTIKVASAPARQPLTDKKAVVVDIAIAESSSAPLTDEDKVKKSQDVISPTSQDISAPKVSLPKIIVTPPSPSSSPPTLPTVAARDTTTKASPPPTSTPSLLSPPRTSSSSSSSTTSSLGSSSSSSSSGPSILSYITGALSTAGHLISKLPWLKIALSAAGLVVGAVKGTVTLLRR